MIGISKKELIDFDPWQYDNQQDLLNAILNKCRELDPWLPLEEFLRSGFEGKCWVSFKDKTVTDSIFIEGQFFGSEVDSGGYRGSFRMKNIANVKPIHKPSKP